MTHKPKVGRPPREDHPVTTTLLLPQVLKRWVKTQAEKEGRSMGLLVEDGLRLYLAKVEARAKRARRERGT